MGPFIRAYPIIRYIRVHHTHLHTPHMLTYTTHTHTHTHPPDTYIAYTTCTTHSQTHTHTYTTHLHTPLTYIYITLIIHTHHMHAHPHTSHTHIYHTLSYTTHSLTPLTYIIHTHTLTPHMHTRTRTPHTHIHHTLIHTTPIHIHSHRYIHQTPTFKNSRNNFQNRYSSSIISKNLKFHEEMIVIYYFPKQNIVPLFMVTRYTAHSHPPPQHIHSTYIHHTLTLFYSSRTPPGRRWRVIMPNKGLIPAHKHPPPP